MIGDVGDPRNGRAIEYTDLRKVVSFRDVEAMCCDAIAYGLGTVVVPTALIRRAAACVEGDSPAIGSVISYPFGTQSACVKAREAAIAVEDGAHDLDVVPHFGAILAERWGDVEAELQEIRAAAESVTLKLVLEVGRLSSPQIREACAIAAQQGFEYVVNTVGFRIVSTDPDAEGAASVGTLESLRELGGDRLKLKAAGGVTTHRAVIELLAAGADRVAVPVSAGLPRSMGWTPRQGGGS